MVSTRGASRRAAASDTTSAAGPALSDSAIHTPVSSEPPQSEDQKDSPTTPKPAADTKVTKADAAGTPDSDRARSTEKGPPTQKQPQSSPRQAARVAKNVHQKEKPVGQDEGLWMVLSRYPTAMPAKVADWIGKVQTVGAAAVAEVLSVVVEAVCPRKEPLAPVEGDRDIEWLTHKDVLNDQVSQTVAQIESKLELLELDAQALLGKDRDARQFRRRFEDMWARMMFECPPEVLYDTDAVETIFSWLLSMANSRVRDLRFAACLSAYQITDGLIRVDDRNRKQIVSLEKQLSIEKKSKKSTDSEKIKEIESKLENLGGYQADLQEHFDNVFTNLFVLKYRDVSPEIRAMSIKALGSWICACPAVFLDDTHLKYLGWVLSDKVPHVRHAALRACKDLLDGIEKSLVVNVEAFLERFAKRMVEMCRDVDPNCSATAVKMCHFLLSMEILNDGQIDQICKQAITESDSKVRNAAGAFIAACLDLKRGKKGSSVDSKQPSSQLRELVLLLFPSRTPYEVVEVALNALWPHLPVLHNFGSYSKLFGQHSNKPAVRRRRSSISSSSRISTVAEDGLDDFQIRNVFSLLLAGLKRNMNDGKQSADNADVASWDTNGATDEVGQNLPKLFSENQADASVTVLLCQMPQFLDLELFKLSGMEGALKETLRALEGSIVRHTASKEVLRHACATIDFLASTEHSLRSECEHTRNSVALSVSKSLHAVLRAGSSRSVTEAAVSSALSRASVAGMHFPLQPEIAAFEDCISLLHHYRDGNERFVKSDAASDIGNIAKTTFLWLWKSCKESSISTSEYLSRRDELIEVLSSLTVGESEILMPATAAVVLIMIITLNQDLAQRSSSNRPHVSCEPSEGNDPNERRQEEMPQTTDKQNNPNETNEPRTTDVSDENSVDLSISEADNIGNMVRKRFGTLYYENEQTEEVSEKEIFEARRNLLAALIQSCESGALPRKFAHVPLIALSDKLMGETDHRIFNLARTYHQDLRERHRRQLCQFEREALLFASQYDCDEESYLTVLASALAQRYAFSKPGSGTEDLILSFLEETFRTLPVDTTGRIHAVGRLEKATIPLAQRLEKSQAQQLLQKVERMGERYFPSADFENDTVWAGFEALRAVLRRETAKVRSNAKKLPSGQKPKPQRRRQNDMEDQDDHDMKDANPAEPSQSTLRRSTRSTRTKRALLDDLQDENFESGEESVGAHDNPTAGKDSTGSPRFVRKRMKRW